jgi:hypothetical protein
MTGARRLRAGLALLTLACSACAAQPDPTAVRATLQQRYGEYRKAIFDRDGNALAALLAPGFTTRNVDGEHTDAAGFVNSIAHLPRDPNMTSTVRITGLHLDGETATAEVTTDLRSRQYFRGNKPVAVRFVTRATDVWDGRGGTWRLERNDDTELDAYENGALVSHKVRGGEAPQLALPTP